MSGTQRISYLDVVRGLASMQVLFGHALRIFLPASDAFARTEAVTTQLILSPLVFIFDGGSAVFIFFCLSGFVLTGAFRFQLQQPLSALGSRLIRLGVPAVAIGVCSYILKLAVGNENLIAGYSIQSPTLLTYWLPKSTGFLLFLKDTIINGLMVGYPGVNVLPVPFKIFEGQLSEAYNAPLWTLSVELQGSIIVFALVWLRQRSRTFWVILFLALFWGLARTNFLCFLVGHLLAGIHPKLSALRLNVWLLAVLVTAGIVLCASQSWWTLEPFNSYCSANIPLSIPCVTLLQHMWGAILIFFAVIAGDRFSEGFERWPLPLLGKLSFPLYLIHWPIMVGLGSWMFLAINETTGYALASLITMVAVCVISIVAARLFIPVDNFAVELSRRVRGRKSGSVAVNVNQIT